MEDTIRQLAPKLVIAASAFGLFLLLAPSAFAQDASNSNTGADSDNDATVTINNVVDINSQNNANIYNTITINANTGNNSADKNTGDGSVNTGDINGSVNISNDINGNTLNSVGINCGGLCNYNFDISTSNSNTGANSDNDASVDVNNDIDITQNNDLNINNNVNADLNTGGNSADKNTGDGSVKTGDINFGVNINNQGNENVIGEQDDEDDSQPGPSPKGPAAIMPVKDEGEVLAAHEGLPITGSSLPILPILGIVLAGLSMRRIEEVLRLRFLTDKK